MLLGAALANDLAQSCSAIGRTTPSAGREHWHGGGGGARQLHGFAASAQVSQPSSYPDKARTGNGSGFLLSGGDRLEVCLKSNY